MREILLLTSGLLLVSYNVRSSQDELNDAINRSDALPSSLDENSEPVENVPPEVTAAKPEFADFPSDFSTSDAQRVIADAGHFCLAVDKVMKNGDALIAQCDDGEKYRLVRALKPVKQDFALKCSALKAQGIEGGC